jgi:hypothetical protein
MDKQEIIEEIRRTAQLNWLRWGDAVEDAGLVPNQMNTALSKDEAIGKLIDLISELGRFPIEGEMSRKRNQDAAFPHHNVFRSKFGGKKSIATAVVNYCRERGGLDDVVEICSGHVDNDEPASADNTQTEQTGADGFVYLMKSGRYYKIGRTDAVGRRHKEIRTQMPEDVEVVHHIGTDDPSGIEAYWHKRFVDKRKNGEWFDLTRADINAFKRRKKFM